MSEESDGSDVRIGILTVSDRASAGLYEDKGGLAIRAALEDMIETPWTALHRMVRDEQPQIEQALLDLADHRRCCLIVTTGGTGPARRDVTPEATVAVCDKLLPGFGELMRAASLRRFRRLSCPARRRASAARA